jgi:protoporphyrinogen IX oxidase
MWRSSLIACAGKPDDMVSKDMTSDAAGNSAGRRAGIALLSTIVITAAVAAIFGERAYLWIKAVHVVAIISWMAGLLYLPRLFIYHCDAALGSVQSETFKVMERRLLSIIMTPAMIISWVLGLWLAWTGGHLSQPWFHAKLALVIGLSAVHGSFSAAAGAFAEDRNDKPPRHWRIVNEVPTLLMIAIVILVIVKPF